MLSREQIIKAVSMIVSSTESLGGTVDDWSAHPPDTLEAKTEYTTEKQPTLGRMKRRCILEKNKEGSEERL